MKILLIDELLNELLSCSEDSEIYGRIKSGNEDKIFILSSVNLLPGLTKIGIWKIPEQTISISIHGQHPVKIKVKKNKIYCNQNDIKVSVLPYKTDYHLRNKGIIEPERFEGKKVVCAGLGSVGSPIAIGFARAGIASFVLIDKDIVELPNICRTVYTLEDIGIPKPLALQHHILDINPRANVETYKENILKISYEKLNDILTGSSLVIAAMDTPAAQIMVNGRVFDKIPAVYPAVYENGTGGEVLFTLPGKTSCMACVLGKLLAQQDIKRGSWDYSSEGQLKPLPGIYPDIQNITIKAVKIGIAILLGEDSSAFAGLIDPKKNILFVGNTKDWLFEYPYHSFWAQTEINLECICQEIGEYLKKSS